jgi:hypothetical protein
MSLPSSKDILSFLDTLQPINFDNLLDTNKHQNHDLKVDATPFVPTIVQKEPEIEEINHTISMPRGSRNCKHYENCEKSDCGFLHELLWYKKENHYLRIMNEHNKEIDHILKYRIRTFPKLLSLYDEQCKYHQKMASLAKHYAEMNCNDVSYLSLEFNIRKPRKNRVDEFASSNSNVEEYIPKNSNVEEYVPKNSKLEETLYLSEQLDSGQNTNLYVPPKITNRGVFRLNENRDKKEYNASWRNPSNTR